MEGQRTGLRPVCRVDYHELERETRRALSEAASDDPGMMGWHVGEQGEIYAVYLVATDPIRFEVWRRIK